MNASRRVMMVILVGAASLMTLSVSSTAQKPGSVKCCVNGIVVHANSQKQCEKMLHGQVVSGPHIYFGDPCHVSNICWCCFKKKVSHIPRSQCQELGGQCFDSEAQAMDACGIPYRASGAHQ